MHLDVASEMKLTGYHGIQNRPFSIYSRGEEQKGSQVVIPSSEILSRCMSQ